MAAAASSLGEQIREELTCSICLELFTRPKVLPCQHTFCQDCLEVHARKEGMSECPNCRQKVTLPSQGVAGLPDNSMAASMCGRLKRQATLSTGEQPKSGKKCSIHPSEEVKLYCKQCQIPACEICLEETHDDHRTTTIKKAAQERSSTVQALINEGRNILDGYYSFIRGLEETEKALNKKKQERDNGIVQAYDQMVQKLTERKDRLLYESEQDHKKNMEKITNGRDTVLADVNELSAVCYQAEQELQQEEVDLVGQSTLLEVVGKYRGKVAPAPVQTQPAVFQPTDTPVPVLGHVKSGGTFLHQGNEEQGEQQPEKVTFGGRGSARGQFKGPVGVAVSEEGKIFVADRGNQRIQVFTLQGTFLRQFSTSFNFKIDDVKIMNPTNVALDGAGNLWVLVCIDLVNFAVMYDKWGNKVNQITKQTMGGRGVAVDTRTNHILITGAGVVHVYNSFGEFVEIVGQGMKEPFSGMKEPFSLAVNRDGHILVSDRQNDSVFVYNEYGQFLLQIGVYCYFNSYGHEATAQLNGPHGICTDGAGNIIVADTDNHCVKMFDKEGKFLKVIAQDVMQPWAVAMATHGPLVVTDGATDTVTIFHKL